MSKLRTLLNASASSRWKRVGNRLRKPIVIVAAIGTVLGGLAGYVTMYRTVTNSPIEEVGVTPAGKQAPNLSVLVLPLSNQTGDPARAYIADGLTTALTSNLSRITDAIVVPPLQAVALQRRELPLDRLGSEASVRYVLQGAVSGSGEKLRVTAHLMDTRTGRQLWSKAFDTDSADLYKVQDDLTDRIRISLGAEMVRHAAQESLARQRDAQVADLLIRSRALGLHPQSLNVLAQQESLARRALEIDPASRQARLQLATALWLLAENYPPSVSRREPDRLIAEAAEHAEALLESDSNDWVALNVLAARANRRLDHDAARRLLERALASDPRRWASYNNLALLYLNWGEPERARELLLKAIALPSYLPPAEAFANLARAANQQGRYDEVIEWAERAIDANPNRAGSYMYLAIGHAMKGNKQQASAAGAELLRRFPDWAWERSQERPWPGKELEWEVFMSERFRPALLAAGLPVK